MRLINADRLKKSFEANTPIAFQDCVPGIHAIIDLEPTVEEEPVRHGKWYVIPMATLGKKPITFRIYRCSECKSTSYEKTPYCCRCGAKMDGRKKE